MIDAEKRGWAESAQQRDEWLAALVHFLVADDCNFINGQAIAVDGGFTAGLSQVAYDTLAAT